MASALPKLSAPKLEGPADAEVTLVGWGGTWGVIHEATELLAEQGIKANHLQVKYLLPFQTEHVSKALAQSKRIVVVENNISGQFARHLRAETGIKADELILKYDGEPFSPAFIVQQLEAILKGEKRSLDVTEAEAREIAYHNIRIKLGDTGRPTQLEKVLRRNYREPVWEVIVTNRNTGEPEGTLIIGAETGATHAWQPQA
jgi:TPP-dependent indolepyruvate ferredoxin oxidoreductase alpha subunit